VVTSFLAEKVGMTQVYDDQGSATAVTVLKLLPMTVTQVKTVKKDGYAAVQVGTRPAKAKHLTKGQQGHLLKHKLPLFRLLKEFRVTEAEPAYELGAEVSYEFLSSAALVDLTGSSIGKGTMGNIRRWGHHRGPMSHGSKSHRLPGSIGAGTTPGRVFKGLQMAGRTGNANVTIQKLNVFRYIPEKQVLLVKGSVPGVEGGLVVGRAR
jgi:large subunit ribosomal protein L3